MAVLNPYQVRLSLLGLGAFSGAPRQQAAANEPDAARPAQHLEARPTCGAGSGAVQGGDGERRCLASEGPRLSATSPGLAVMSTDFKLNLHALKPPPPPDSIPGGAASGERRHRD